MLRQFGGYTLQSLMDEDPLLLRLMKIEAMGRPVEPMRGGE